MTDDPLPHTRHIHAVIRQSGKFLMLYSKAYGYYKFLHGEMQEDETPEQALCRIVPAQTGLTVCPESIRPCCKVEYHPANGNLQEHLYFRCSASGERTAESPDDRFALTAISRGQALQTNRQSGHGLLSDDAAFRAMLKRENLALQMYPRLTPLQSGGIALAVSLLFPPVAGLYLLVTGFHSPTDGGTLTGKDAFQLGAILGCVPAAPAAVISLIWMIGNRKRRAPGIYTVADNETGTARG